MNNQPPHLVPQRSVEALVFPFIDDFVDLVESAWEDWRQLGIAHRLEHPRVRAGVMWNQIINRARDRFHGRAGISVQKMGDYCGFTIEGRIFIRPKYGRGSMLSSNYPTRRALAFNDAAVDLFQGMGRLDLVYTLNELETEVAGIALVQRDGKRVGWAMPLLRNDGQMPLPEVLLPRSPQGTPAQRIIKPKKANVDHHERRDGTHDAAP